MKRGLVIGVICIGITLAIAAATLLKERSQSGAKVRGVVAAQKNITSRVLAQGTLRAKRQVEVASEITGRVKAIFVEEGQNVDVGAPLFSIDEVDYQNAVEQLEVGLKAAKANRARAYLMRQEAERQRARDEKLKSRGLVVDDLYAASVSRVSLADADVRAALAQIERAELELTRAKDALTKAMIKAPIAGTVVSVPLEVGQVVTAGLTQSGSGMFAQSAPQGIVVADLSELIAKLTVDELDIANVVKGKSCTLQTQGEGAEKIPGEISKVGLLGREIGGAVQFTVEAFVKDGAAFSNVPSPTDQKNIEKPAQKPARLLRSGMSVTAEIEVQRVENVTAIPITAVLEGSAKSGGKPDRVFVIEGTLGTTAQERVVTLGPNEGDLIAILDGLKEGEKVVEGPFRALRALDDGDPIDVEKILPLPGDEDSAKNKGAKESAKAIDD